MYLPAAAHRHRADPPEQREAVTSSLYPHQRSAGGEKKNQPGKSCFMPRRRLTKCLSHEQSHMPWSHYRVPAISHLSCGGMQLNTIIQALFSG